MDTRNLELALSMLLQEIEQGPEDDHELYMKLRQTLQSMRAVGMPVPDDLVRLEEELAEEFGPGAADVPGEGAGPARRRPPAKSR